MAERAAVNRYVVGSNPTPGVMETETTLAKTVGRAEVGTPVTVIGPKNYDPNLFECILNGKERILFRDELNLEV